MLHNTQLTEYLDPIDPRYHAHAQRCPDKDYWNKVYTLDSDTKLDGTDGCLICMPFMNAKTGCCRLHCVIRKNSEPAYDFVATQYLLGLCQNGYPDFKPGAMVIVYRLDGSENVYEYKKFMKDIYDRLNKQIDTLT